MTTYGYPADARAQRGLGYHFEEVWSSWNLGPMRVTEVDGAPGSLVRLKAYPDAVWLDANMRRGTCGNHLASAPKVKAAITLDEEGEPVFRVEPAQFIAPAYECPNYMAFCNAFAAECQQAADFVVAYVPHEGSFFPHLRKH